MQKGYLGYYSIYSINIYIFYYYVVELYACRDAQTWWGAALACLRRSLIRYVTSREYVVITTLFLVISIVLFSLIFLFFFLLLLFLNPILLGLFLFAVLLSYLAIFF
jgi:hypothetical protein